MLENKNFHQENTKKSSHLKEIKKSTRINNIVNKFGWFFKFIGFLGRKLVMKLIWPTKICFKSNANIDGRAIAICNHYTALDANAILSRVFGKNDQFLMKKEACDNSLSAGFLLTIGGIPITRGESDVSAIKKVIRCLNSENKLLIFPEGTRNHNENFKDLLPFKDGPATFAIKTKSPIIPMLYYNRVKPFRKNILMIGEPFYLEQFYGKNFNECKEESTAFVVEKMQQLRVEIDLLVEKYKGNTKKYMQAKNKEI